MRLLSYNIQAGINSQSYWSYSYQWPRQLLPLPAKNRTIARIGAFLRAFEVACLQEIDLGGLRNGFRNHAVELAALGGFPHFASQLNRRLGKLSWHGNVILSRQALEVLVDAPLPGKIAGRGMLAVRVGDVVIANAHLSLGLSDRKRQLAFLQETLAPYPRVVLVGDFNCEAADLTPLLNSGFTRAPSAATFPSWKPRRTLDHALGRGVALRAEVSPFRASDHRPLIITLEDSP